MSQSRGRGHVLLITSVALVLGGAPKAFAKPAEEVLAATKNHVIYPDTDQVCRGDLRFSMGTLAGWGVFHTILGARLMAGGPQVNETLFWHGVSDLSFGAANLAIGGMALASAGSIRGRLQPPSHRAVARAHEVFFVVDLLAVAGAQSCFSRHPSRVGKALRKACFSKEASFSSSISRGLFDIEPTTAGTKSALSGPNRPNRATPPRR